MDMMAIRRRVLLGIKSQGTYVYRIDNVPPPEPEEVEEPEAE